jgi:tRNA pseudouridine55 synthase
MGGANMDAILCINKPVGYSCMDILSFARKAYQCKKVGHIGSLDKQAAGVLLITLGEASKIVNYLENEKRTYAIRLSIGKATCTGDGFGQVIRQKEIIPCELERLSYVLSHWKEEYYQVPQVFGSNMGKTRVEDGFKNKDTSEVEKKPVLRRIYSLEQIDEMRFANDEIEVLIRAVVSKGTSLRQLAVDIGEAIHYPSYLISYTRSRYGVFGIEEASSFEDLKEGKAVLYPSLYCFSKSIIIRNEELSRRASHGMVFSSGTIYEQLQKNPKVIVFARENQIIAIYEKEENVNYYKAAHVWSN